MFFSLILCVTSSLFSFTNTEIPSGSILQHWIDVEGGILDHNFTFLQCKGSCHFELLIYPEANKSEVFKDIPGNQLICCDPKDFECQPHFLFYNNKSTAAIHRIFQIEGTPIENENKTKSKNVKKAQKGEESVKPVTNSKKGQAKTQQKYPLAFMMDSERVLYSVVLANCGEQPFRLTGHITIHPENGYLDLRLTSSKYFSTFIFLFGAVFTVAWYMIIHKKRPRLAVQHYFFIGSSGFYAGFTFFLCLLFWIWSLFGVTNILVTLFASICRAACICGLLYCTISGLQMPQEIKYTDFAAVVVILSISSFVEISGIEAINSRGTGRWLFGFGAVPFLDFLVITIASIVILVISVMKAPEETSDDPKRKQFLIYFIASFAVYFLLSSVIAITTIGSSVTSGSSSYFLGFITCPVYLTLLLAANAKFWMEYNPNGWEPQKFNGTDQSDNDIGLFDDNATEFVGPAHDSLIPEVAVKKSDKRKKKSDDGFDIDDDFSGGEPLEIEEKID